VLLITLAIYALCTRCVALCAYTCRLLGGSCSVFTRQSFEVNVLCSAFTVFTSRFPPVVLIYFYHVNQANRSVNENTAFQAFKAGGTPKKKTGIFHKTCR
jgi:hypothetical protein